MKVTQKGGGFLFFLLIIIPVMTYSLDLASGRIRLEINEKNGSFNLESFPVDGGQPLPLIYPDDPRTSYFSIVVNNRIYNLPSSSDFKKESFQEGYHRVVLLSSRQLEIRQEFRLLRSVSSMVENGIAMDLKIRNISSRKLSVGLRYIIDTYLGEHSGTHFIGSDNRSINRETRLTTPYPWYVFSPQGKSVNRGLMLMLQGPGVTLPDSVVLANWKRLNESSWSYQVNPSRSFSNPPYSINDSAVALYYDPVQLKPGEERIITLAFGEYAPGGYVPDSQKIDDALSDLISSETETGDPVKEVALVRELLTRIDLLIKAEEEVPEEKVRLLRQLLENLKNRKTDFNN